MHRWVIFLPIEERIGFMLEVLKNNQNIISFADTKSNISLTIQSLLISIGLGVPLSSNVLGNVQKINGGAIPYFFYTLSTLFIISSFVGILFSIFAYKARSSKPRTEKGLFYFGHIVQFTNVGDYLSEINNINDDSILNEFTQSAYELSHIAKKKLGYVNNSICFLILNLVLAITLLILSSYINTHYSLEI